MEEIFDVYVRPEWDTKQLIWVKSFYESRYADGERGARRAANRFAKLKGKNHVVIKRED